MLRHTRSLVELVLPGQPAGECGRASRTRCEGCELHNAIRSAAFPCSDRCGADDDEEEWLRIAVMPQPPAPIGPVNGRWRGDWLRVRVPLAEVGAGSFARRPRRVNCRLMRPLGAMEPGTGAPVARHRHRHSVDDDCAAITEMPPQEHATCLGCVAAMLNRALHRRFRKLCWRGFQHSQ